MLLPVEPTPDLSFSRSANASPAARAASLARPAAPGHWDELRGGLEPDAPPTPEWARFFDELGNEGLADLDRRTLNLERQIRDNGVTYNVYAEAGGPQRPWSLDLFPLIVTPEDWQHIEAGVLQRVQLLDALMADVYGPQRLLSAGLLPPALVHGHPGYLHAMHGVQPAGGRHLHIAAFDLARDPQGRWWVMSQRTQAPSGLGYLLENRLVISRLFPEAFDALRVQRLAASYSALLESVRQMAPAGMESPRIVLLTPGPYNETYFEHAFLARYLGLTLVEGSDLTVRGDRLYLKTLDGLEPVHGLLKRLDDEFLDPLELRPDSRLGVPGLLQVIRAGNVLVANAPGSGLLESSALLGFLPSASQELLGAPLLLPSAPTWWCGERAAREAVLPQLATGVIKPTYGGAGAGSLPGYTLSPKDLAEWSARITREPDEFTVQQWLPASQLPTWKQQRIEPRSLTLRVFAVSDGAQGWRVLPGGLTRLAGGTLHLASMQSGGSSADTWVLTRGEVDRSTLLHQGQPAGAVVAQRERTVTSRAAENLFWLGRYTERTENTARLARIALECLNGENPTSPALQAWLHELATANALVAPGTPSPQQSRRVFERALIAAIADSAGSYSVGFNLAALRQAASSVRERLSLEQWNQIVRAENDFRRGCALCIEDGDSSPVEAVRVLEQLSGHLAATTGAQTDRMTRDKGWRLLSVGRHLERLAFLAAALADGLDTNAVFDPSGFDAVVALFDSTITFRRIYQRRSDLPALVDLLVLDRDNPRSLGWVLQTLRGRLARLAQEVPGHAPAMEPYLPDPESWDLESLCEQDAQGHYAVLQGLLRQCMDAAWQLSDDLATRYFTHTGEARQSVGA